MLFGGAIFNCSHVSSKSTIEISRLKIEFSNFVVAGLKKYKRKKENYRIILFVVLLTNYSCNFGGQPLILPFQSCRLCQVDLIDYESPEKSVQ